MKNKLKTLNDFIRDYDLEGEDYDAVYDAAVINVNNCVETDRALLIVEILDFIDAEGIKEHFFRKQ